MLQEKMLSGDLRASGMRPRSLCARHGGTTGRGRNTEAGQSGPAGSHGLDRCSAGAQDPSDRSTGSQSTGGCSAGSQSPSGSAQGLSLRVRER